MSKRPDLTHGLLLVPLIGASGTLATALGLWLAWLLVMLGHTLAMNLVRPLLTTSQRLIACVVLAATLTACTTLLAQAWALELYQPLVIYMGWIALSCVMLEHERELVGLGWSGRLRLAGLFGLFLTGLGTLRELLAASGLSLATLVPGGFILLGLVLAVWQAWSASRPHSTTEESPRP